MEKLKDNRCPSCNVELFSHTGLTNHPPVPGDYSVCDNCLDLIKFSDTGLIQIDELEKKKVRSLSGFDTLYDMAKFNNKKLKDEKRKNAPD